MIEKDYFFNVKCDICGHEADDMWYNNEHDAETYAHDKFDFMYLGGKHYCPDCYDIVDDDIIITKDGRYFDFETEEEICSETMKSS